MIVEHAQVGRFLLDSTTAYVVIQKIQQVESTGSTSFFSECAGPGPHSAQVHHLRASRFGESTVVVGVYRISEVFTHCSTSGISSCYTASSSS
jgi:hypothetical protein